jgi:quercetin dioxygenase-like cupin family protein
MLQDVAARRATEIETLNGGIVTAGAACGVATPRHQAVRARIRGLEHSWRQSHLWTNGQTACNNKPMHGAQKIDWGQQAFTEARPGIFGATVHTPHLTAILYRYGAGTSWEEHQHPQDQITTVLSGAIDFVVDGTPLRLSAGELATLPGGTPHSATVSEPAVSLNILTHRNAPPSPSA